MVQTLDSCFYRGTWKGPEWEQHDQVWVCEAGWQGDWVYRQGAHGGELQMQKQQSEWTFRHVLGEITE